MSYALTLWRRGLWPILQPTTRGWCRFCDTDFLFCSFSENSFTTATFISISQVVISGKSPHCWDFFSQHRAFKKHSAEITSNIWTRQDNPACSCHLTSLETSRWSSQRRLPSDDTTCCQVGSFAPVPHETEDVWLYTFHAGDVGAGQRERISGGELKVGGWRKKKHLRAHCLPRGARRLRTQRKRRVEEGRPLKSASAACTGPRGVSARAHQYQRQSWRAREGAGGWGRQPNYKPNKKKKPQTQTWREQLGAAVRERWIIQHSTSTRREKNRKHLWKHSRALNV